MASQSYQEIAGLSGQARYASPTPFLVDQDAVTWQPAVAGRPLQGQQIAHCQPEVVFVFEQFSLIDAESYQRVYSRKSGHPLARGYYVVTWPTGHGGGVFGDEAQFHGPYRSRQDAENSLVKSRAALSPDIQHARNRAAVASLELNKVGAGQGWIVSWQQQA